MSGATEVQEGHCPYCSAYEPCEHVLLIFDETAGEACNGPLSDAFSHHLAPTAGTERSTVLRHLLEQVAKLASRSSSEMIDGLAVEECVLRTFYCENPEQVETALREFGAAGFSE